MSVDSSSPARPVDRNQAWTIIRAALQAVEPGACVRKCLALDGDRLLVTDPQDGQTRAYDLTRFERVLVVGGGKAGAPMANAVAALLGQRLKGGGVVVKYGHADPDQATNPDRHPIQIFEAGHPIPDQSGLDGAQGIIRLLQDTTERDLVLCLISGGGSALMTAPVTGISLADLQALTQLLLGCGATINQINTIRKHISRLKGGQLARLAAPATVISLILSDVVGDPLDVIASGPTVPDTSRFDDAWSVLTYFDVVDQVPASIIRHLEAGRAGDIPDTPKPGDPLFERVQNAVIGSNRVAARAAAKAAQAQGFDTVVLTTFLEGEARQVARVIAGLAKGMVRGEAVHPHDQPLKKPACLLLGGETTVTLQGGGRGGRNQEMALAAALALQGWDDVLIAFLATDGTDGPTDAAGAFADGNTVKRAKELGLDAEGCLARNDSYPFFQQLGDLILTGPTQTNVNDLVLVLVG